MKKTISLFLISVLHFHGFSQCQANAGQDTTVYQGSVITVGTDHQKTNKNLIYRWSPENMELFPDNINRSAENMGLSCTDCPTPVIQVHHDVQLTLTVTDTVTHCIASDKILIRIARVFAADSDEETFDAPPPVDENPPAMVEKENDIVEYPDESPQFPGGNTAFINFLGNNIQYPQTAIKEGLQGKCWIGFIVDKEGNMTDFKVLRKVSGCPECDAEALRVLKLMPKWIPGKSNGKPVKCNFQVPIVFKLDQAPTTK